MGTAQHHEARVSLLDGQPLNLPHYPQRAFSDDNRVLKKDRSMNNRYTNTGSAYGAPKTSGVPHQSFFRYHPSSLAQWAFLGLTLGQLVLCVALECYIFAIFNKEIKDSARDPTNLPTETKAITIFLTIFIFGFLYELLLVWDALRGRNTLQICGVCIYNLALMIYAAIQPDQIDKALQLLAASNLLDMPRDELFGKLKPFFVAIPIIIAAFSVAMAWVSWKLYREFAWVIYKQISADLRMKQRFLQYQVSYLCSVALVTRLV